MGYRLTERPGKKKRHVGGSSSMPATSVTSILLCVMLAALGGCMTESDVEYLTPPDWIRGAWAPRADDTSPQFLFGTATMKGYVGVEWLDFQSLAEGGALIAERISDATYEVEYKVHGRMEMVAFAKLDEQRVRIDHVTRAGTASEELVRWSGPKSAPCEYQETHGIAVIKSISVAETHDNGAWDWGMEVQFDFTPFAPNARVDYLQPNHPDVNRKLVASCSREPLPEWLEDEGIRVGARFRCTRCELIEGTCDPTMNRSVVFLFDDLGGGWSGY